MPPDSEQGEVSLVEKDARGITKCPNSSHFVSKAVDKFLW